MQFAKQLISSFIKRGRCRRFLIVLIICYIASNFILRFSDHSAIPLGDELTSLATEEPEQGVFPSMENEEPLIERAISDQDYAARIESKIVNLPLISWQKNKKRKCSGQKCAKFPSLYEMSYNNIYWQTLKTQQATFYFYNAFYDNRTLTENKPVIRILSMTDKTEPHRTYCQLWFDGVMESVVTPVIEYRYMWYKAWGNYKDGILQPYLITCAVPNEHKHLVPESVSLAENPYDKSTTNLRIINNYPESGKKEDFAVCVKGLDIGRDDTSVRITEWLEILFALGAHKVYMYDLDVHPNVSKVLNYYKAKDLVDITKLTLPGEQPNIPGLIHMYFKAKVIHKLQNELIPYNDCLYKNMNRYRYIVLLDIDEFIMPRKTLSWKDLMDIEEVKASNARNITRDSYAVRNVYFLDNMQHSHGWAPDIPKYMHMLQHVYRAKNYTAPGTYIKCFHNPERILSLHNHFPRACLGKGCSTYSIDKEDAHLQHYRSNCVSELRKRCEEDFNVFTEQDTAIWRLKDSVIPRVKETLTHLGFLKRVKPINPEYNEN